MICVRLKIRRTKVPIKWPLIGQNDEHWILAALFSDNQFAATSLTDIFHTEMEDKSGASLQRGLIETSPKCILLYFIPIKLKSGIQK